MRGTAEGGMAGSVWISWSTGQPTLIYNTAQLPQPANQYANTYPQPPTFQFAPQTPDPDSVASEVNWGLLSGKYLSTAVGTARSYIQTYLFSGPTFQSQLFHRVHVTGIPYGKKCAKITSLYLTHPSHLFSGPMF
ncbi:hypothetical protein WJX81_002970 [Elliptochloris bilobata]|uniref:Uncharacterized protein n=1 Tax=Elliptochloris bilobata TaxID=381761 RepID=A0AAW1SG83_9CHLO